MKNQPLGGDSFERQYDGEIILGIIFGTAIFALIGALCVGYHGFLFVKGLLS